MRAGGEVGNKGQDGWHHRLNGHKSEQAPGDGEDREAWRAAVHGVASSVQSLSCVRLFVTPASGPFQITWFFTSGGQSIGVSASTSVLPVNIQD